MDTAARWRELFERIERVAFDLARAAQHVAELEIAARKLQEDSKV